MSYIKKLAITLCISTSCAAFAEVDYSVSGLLLNNVQVLKVDSSTEPEDAATIATIKFYLQDDQILDIYKKDVISRVLYRSIIAARDLLIKNGHTISSSFTTELAQKIGLAYKSTLLKKVYPPATDWVDYSMLVLDVASGVAIKIGLDNTSMSTDAKLAWKWVLTVIYNDIKAWFLVTVTHDPIKVVRAGVIDNLWVIGTDIAPALITAAGTAWSASSELSAAELREQLLRHELNYKRYISTVVLPEDKDLVYSQLDDQFNREITLFSSDEEKRFINQSRVAAKAEIMAFDQYGKYNTLKKFYVENDEMALRKFIEQYFSYVHRDQILSDFLAYQAARNVNPPASADEKYNPFDDVGSDHWASCYVRKLWKAGIVNGQAGLFKPSSNVTRAEFLKMTMNSAFSPGEFSSTTPNGGTVTFYKDTDFVVWQYPYVNTALQKNVLDSATGQPCSPNTSDVCFSPNMPITRADAVTFLVRAFKLQFGALQSELVLSTFSDALYSQYQDVYVAASNVGDGGCDGKPEAIISGFDDRTFRPATNITRDQAAKIIAVALSFKKR